MRSVVTVTCGCSCQPCEEGQTLCLTSNICINSTFWCNGVNDCPDDEINCDFTTTLQPTIATTEDPHKKCPMPSCPPGYEVVEKVEDKKSYSYLATMFSTYRSKGTFAYVQKKVKGMNKGKFLK